MQQITAHSLKCKMEKKENMVVIDVLPEDSFNKRHLPGAINIPLARLPKEAHKLPKHAEIVVYCASRSCQQSAKAARLLDSMGFKVLDFESGLKGWEDATLNFEAP